MPLDPPSRHEHGDLVDRVARLEHHLESQIVSLSLRLSAVEKKVWWLAGAGATLAAVVAVLARLFFDHAFAHL